LKVISAMHSMKWIDDDVGQSIYGSSFRTYDSFVLQHAVAEQDPRGDQAHLGTHFVVWHTLFLLQFEESLLAIDSSIGAMPYWDMTEGFDGIFGSGDTDLGSIRGTDSMSAVVDGAFSNWTVRTLDDAFLDLYPGRANVNGSFGTYEGEEVLRTSTAPTKGILRFPSCTDVTPLDNYTWDSYDLCASQTQFLEFYWCLEQVSGGSHEPIHFYVGSANSTELGFYCTDFAPPRLSETVQGDFIDKMTSVNDPLFFFHHNFVVMQWHEFMQRSASGLASYWDFPAANATLEGSMLLDVISDAWPFSGSSVFVNTSGAPTGALTFADAICWLTPDAAPYTYDRVTTSTTVMSMTGAPTASTASPSSGAPTASPTAADASSGCCALRFFMVLLVSAALCFDMA